MATITPFPSEAYCPITHDVMNDPWMDNEGISYEKNAIMTWLATGNSTSPSTRNPMLPSDLRPNLALKSIIDSIKQKNATISIETLPPPKPEEIIPSIQCFTDKTHLKVKVLYNDDTLLEGCRTPTDLIFNVDLSYSMEDPASKKQDAESQMFSILSLVKHSMKTIVKGLNENDHLGIVAFANSATIKLRPLQMTEENKNAAILCIERLRTCGSTNFWSGIRESFKCFELFERPPESDGTIKLNNPTILTFTDGRSNIDPASGLMNTLKRFNASNKIPVIMQVFGFGPDLDVDLLFETAKMFGGRFDFISDFSMVGTVFVNALTNILMTATSQSKINITCPDNNKIKKVYAMSDSQSTQEVTIDSQAIMYGQPREFIVEFENPLVDFCNTNVVFKSSFTKNNETCDFACHASSVQENRNEVEHSLALAYLANILSETPKKPLNDMKNYLEYEKTKMHNSSFSSEIKNSEIWKAMMEDLSGQLLMATNSEYFNEWGKKYLYAYWFALMSQQCNNFKDKVVAYFGSAKSRDLLLKLEDIYMDIPPPQTIQRQVVNASDFISRTYNASGGCVYAETLVTILTDNFEVKNITAEEVEADMMILTRDTSKNAWTFSKVEYITELEYSGNLIWYENDTGITAWHPVWDETTQTYIFPIRDERKTNIRPMKFGHWNPMTPKVYNFVLENRGDLVLGDISIPVTERIAMITFGHGIENDEVAQHDYFGTERVVNDIKVICQNIAHIVKIAGILRDPKTHRVNKITFINKR